MSRSRWDNLFFGLIAAVEAATLYVWVKATRQERRQRKGEMDMTPSEAARLIPHLEPLLFDAGYGQPYPITPDHMCVTEAKLNELGMKGEDLYQHPWYDLIETDHEGKRVHVVSLRGIRAYAGGKRWAEEEAAREAARGIKGNNR